MKIEHLSSSNLGKYLECPFKYYLRYVLKVDMPTFVGTINGTIIHEVFERILRGAVDAKEWKEQLAASFREHESWKAKKNMPLSSDETCEECEHFKEKVCVLRSINEHEQGCPKDAHKEAAKLCKKTIDDKGSPLYTPNDKILEVEEKFDIVLENGLRILGYMDLVREIDKETLEIVDWKSGKMTKKYKEVRNDPQAWIYCLAAKHLYPKYKYYLLTLHYIRKEPIQVSFDDSEIEQILVILKKRWEEIKNCKMPTRTFSWQCKLFCIGRKVCNKCYQKLKRSM